MLDHADLEECMPNCLTQVISWGEVMELFIFQLKMFEKFYTQPSRIAFVSKKKAVEDLSL